MNSLSQLFSGELKGTKKIKLSCNLSHFPNEIFDHVDTLQYLDLSGNELSTLPHDFGRLVNLKILFLSDNKFTSIPTVISQCKNLDIIGFKSNQLSNINEDALPHNIRWLILTNNFLTSVPRSIGNCKRLQKCMLAGNLLENLPEEMSQCKNLELLRISANKLKSLPHWLFTLPKLSWLAFAGNDFQNAEINNHKLLEISWNELDLQEQLGEGASGMISKATYSYDPSKPITKNVAVKVFKGAVTSDGLPKDEMGACIGAGLHPNLIPVIGKIKDHPQHKQGLVMELISKNYKNLGGPPSLESCTRDIYPENTIFTIHQVKSILKGVASVCAHLHSQKINHGDLYAHNLLINDNGYPLLSDFGAASSYNLLPDAVGMQLQLIEVRAFGCLIDDLLNHLELEKVSQDTLELLKCLGKEAMQEKIGGRPTFKDICLLLNKTFPI